MLSFDEALARLIESTVPLGASEELPTAQALGRVLMQDVVSLLDVPPADNSAMDGYAIRAADAGKLLPISQRIPAGTVGTELAPGTAARIFTGAQIPAGADAVVMQEFCELEGDAIRVTGEAKSGQHIRLRGEDVQRNSTVLATGHKLDAAALGMAAAVGAAKLKVSRKPRVALFSTGDELVMPGEPLRPGAIYNSNRYMLQGLLQGLGCEVVDLGIVPDKLDATRAALREAAAQADLIVTSGGVSVGEEDHLRPAVQAEGSLDLWQIALKPGKPLAFGKVANAYFLGLPGNPVSSFVTFLMLVRPVILRLQGATELHPRRYALRADFTWGKPDKRREFLRARLNPQGGLDRYANQGSGVLTSAVWGDGLVDTPAGQTIAAGDTVQFLPFTELLS